MVLAYIKLYLRKHMVGLSILELGLLQAQISQMIRTRCDQLLAETAISVQDDFIIQTIEDERRIDHAIRQDQN